MKIKWTTEPPREAGLWWVRGSCIEDGIILVGNEQNEGLFVGIGYTHYTELDSLKYRDEIEFSVDPIEVPE